MSDTQWQEQHDEHAELLRLVNEVREQMITRIPLHPNFRPLPQYQSYQFSTPAAPLPFIVHIEPTQTGLYIRLQLADGTPVGEHRWMWADVCSVCEGTKYDYRKGRPCAACKGTGTPPQPVEVKR